MQHLLHDFTVGERQGATDDAGGLTLAPDADHGHWLSPVYAAEPFDELIPGWNAWTPGASWTELSVRVRLADGWSGWLSLGRWGTGIERGSVGGQGDERVTVAVDTVTCRGCTADGWQARVSLHRDPASGAGPTLVDLSVWTGHHAARQPLSDERHPAWGRTIDVPTRSQAVEAEDLRWHVCSPTSLGMVLAHYGVAQPTVQVCEGVFDYGRRIWGNWPFNAAYVLPASGGRLIGHVKRWDSLRPLEDEIAAGRPVVLSHRWGPGDLQGAHSPQSTSGHLIVVVGFDERGNVVVNDPAFDPTKGESVRQVYRRQEVYRTWLERAAGVVYTVRETAPPGEPVHRPGQA